MPDLAQDLAGDGLPDVQTIGGGAAVLVAAAPMWWCDPSPALPSAPSAAVEDLWLLSGGAPSPTLAVRSWNASPLVGAAVVP